MLHVMSEFQRLQSSFERKIGGVLEIFVAVQRGTVILRGAFFEQLVSQEGHRR
jgi:hypothetical protein